MYLPENTALLTLQFPGMLAYALSYMEVSTGSDEKSWKEGCSVTESVPVSVDMATRVYYGRWCWRYQAQ